jgi:STAS domain-containing protein
MTRDSTILTFPRATNSAGRRALRKRLRNALRTSELPIIVDFSGSQTLDHEDIDLLLDCVSQVAGRDTQLWLSAGSRAIEVLLDVIRISRLVPVFSSVDEALGFMSRRRTMSKACEDGIPMA